MATTRPVSTINSKQNVADSAGQSGLMNAAAQSYMIGQADTESLYDVMLALMARKMIDLAVTVEKLHIERARKAPQYVFSTEKFQVVKNTPAINEKEMAEEVGRVIAAMKYASDKWNLFALILQYLKLDTRATEFLAAQDASSLLAKIERLFVLDLYTDPTAKDIQWKLRSKFNLMDDTVIRIVIPLTFAMQADQFLKRYQSQIIERFPRLAVLFKAEEKASRPLELRALSRGVVVFADSHFDSYDATLIRSTLFSEEKSVGDGEPWEVVAAKPPRSSQEVEKFLDNFPFNPKCKVTDLVFFADKFKECVQPNEQFDMTNWFFAKPGTVMQFGGYTVTVEAVNYAAGKDATHTYLDLLPPLSDKLPPQADRNVEFKLLVKNAAGISEHVAVYFFKTQIGKPLDLSRKHDFKKFYQLMTMKKTVAYSAAGREEAGYAVFLSVLARQFEKVYEKNDLQKIVKNVTALLKRLRGERPDLMLNKNQFWILIRVSIKLFQYHICLLNRASTSTVLENLKQAQEQRPTIPAIDKSESKTVEQNKPPEPAVKTSAAQLPQPQKQKGQSIMGAAVVEDYAAKKFK